MDTWLNILVVDDDIMMAKTLHDILKLKGYNVEVAHSGAEALKKVAETPFDCVLSDIKMPEIDGIGLFRAIKIRQPKLPVVLMTAYTESNVINAGLEEGAVGILTKPLDISLLLTFFSFLRKEQSVVIVDDDPSFCKTLSDLLEVQGFSVTQVNALEKITLRLDPDSSVVLLDMKLNDIGGLEVFKELRTQYPNLPVVLVTGYREQMHQAIGNALEIGAYTCLYKPLNIERLFSLLDDIHRQQLRSVLETPRREKP